MAEKRIIRAQEGNQWEFVSASTTECALLGQAGGGKSYALLLDFLYDKDKAAHNGIIFRKTYRDLEDLISKAHMLYPSQGGNYREQKHCWEFPSGARLWMSYLDHPRDVYRYLGWEFTWIGWDELPQFGRMEYLFLMSRLRSPDASIVKRVRATGNADGPGVGWVWDRFCDSQPEGSIFFYTTIRGKDVRVSREQGVSRSWFFSTREQNKELMEADPDYEKNLDLLPNEKLRQAYKFGVRTIVDEPDQLIKTEWWDAACNGKNSFIDGPKAFGIDYAELGGDKSVAVVGRGNQPFLVTEYEYVPHPAMARIIADLFHQHGKFQIQGAIDTIGTGAGVYTSLQEIGEGYADRTNPVRYRDVNYDKAHDWGAVKIHFRNLQEQILYKLKEDFEAGTIDLSLLSTSEHFYENLYLLKEEVLSVWYKPEKGELQIATSNDLRRAQRPDGRPSLGRSPDRLKALAIWNFYRDWTPEATPQFNRGADDYGYGNEKASPWPTYHRSDKPKSRSKGHGFV